MVTGLLEMLAAVQEMRQPLSKWGTSRLWWGKDLSVFPWAKAMSSGIRLSGVLTSSWHAPGHQAPQGIRLGQGRVFGRLPLGG